MYSKNSLIHLTAFSLVALAAGVFAAGFDMQSTANTVVHVKKTGSFSGNDPILMVSGTGGQHKSFGAIMEGSWRAVTGQVPSYTVPFPGLPAGIAGAGPIGVTGLGSGSSSPVIGGHFMSQKSGTYGNSYGIEVIAQNGQHAYGVYARAQYGTVTNYAAYFAGNTYATGLYEGSDRMFKKNIADYTDGLAKVLLLRPKSYDTKSEEFKNAIILPKGKRVGLIAQELEEVFPELVAAAHAPALLSDEEMKAGVTREGLDFKAVNYIGLIPVLIGAIQQQQAQIDALRAELNARK